MALGRTTQVTIGSDAFQVSTKLRTGASPTIETLVSLDGRIVFRTNLPIDDLSPLLSHDDEILRRVEAQHSAVLREVQTKKIGLAPREFLTSSSNPLEKALSHLSNQEFQWAETELHRLLESDPGFTEARELLEIMPTGSGEKAPVASIADRLRAGAEALTQGWKSSAIQNWARGLSVDPSNRIYQLLILLMATPSPERRTGYLRELLEISRELLATSRPEEAHALLLALQAIEEPESVSPMLSPDLPETRGSDSSISRDPTTRRHRKPTDTQPALFVPPAWPPHHEGRERAEEVDADATPTEAAEVGDDAEPVHHPERKAALVEASRAEWEASHRRESPASRSSTRYLSRKALWARLSLRSALAVAGVAVLILVTGGLVALRTGKKEGGRRELETAARLSAAGQFQQAIGIYDRLLGRGQLPTQAYLGRARARLASGAVEEGLSDFARAAELAPKSVDILEETADSLYSRGRFGKAAEYYTRTISLGRDTADVRYRLATSLVQENRAGEALHHLEIAIGLQTSHGEARYLYGKLLNDLGRYAEAEKEFRGARAKFDPGVDYLVELGIALLGQDKLEGAEELARELAQREPSDARAHTLLGEIYLERKRLEASRQELILALQANTEQPRAHLALARVWLALGRSRGDPTDLMKAKQILEEGHGIPESKRLLALAEVSLAEGDSEGAIHLLESALAHGCERLPARLALAEARFAARDFTGAAEELEAAELLAPTDAAIALSLGLLHWQQNNFPFASREYLKALHRVGLTQPVEENSGPVVLPSPYLTLPLRFDVNRAIRDTYRQALAQNEDDEIAAALKHIAESTSFLIGGQV